MARIGRGLYPVVDYDKLLMNVEKFEGIWYEVQRNSDLLLDGDCGSIHIQSVNESFYFTNDVVNDNFADSITGTVTQENTTAKLTLRWNDDDNAIDFWIITTNYIGHAVAYSCQNINNNVTSNQRLVSVWGLTRGNVATDGQIVLINNTLGSALNLTIQDLEAPDHSDDACYALPVIETGRPIILPGNCDPNIPVQQQFSASEFLGTWHEISSYYSESATGKCPRAEYSDGGDRVLVLNSQVINQTLDTTAGYAVVNSSDNSARLLVTLEISDVPQELLIISTDYSSFAISYSCIDLPDNQKRVYSWILSRTRQLPPSAQIEVNRVINSILYLNNAYYEQADQTDDGCFYFPEPSPDEVVEFRNQCDETIPVVSNFDIAAYLGLWHDIESYPSGFQEGQCHNALYTLRGDVVDVFNTQVINQNLDTIRGTAVPISGDGSGKLLVTFPIAGTNASAEMEYWVLSTDYTSYSLVYSCTYNPETDTRRVFSWKLSRTKELSSTANQEINNVMSGIPVLDQQYYINRDQSPEGCFYYPEPESGVTVIFPGQCNTTIPVVEDFNLANFNGTWYEIQSYPKEFLPGHCVRHESTQSGNTLILQSFAVADQFLEEISSEVTSTDNSGRLTITVNKDGESTTMPFWILATDYNDYALAYSCVNINSDFRRIHSWKLSRTQSLTAPAAATIDNFIANAGIEVLNNNYFENIDHNDNACFYLPELAPGEPVILVGQCDLNINVVQNFQPSRYEGLWHLIETYPSGFQSGDCNDATYTVQSDGTVLVFNTQVIDQSLDTITGSAVLASNDSSAKLKVTFPTADQDSDYWVLDTDYDSYSFVYSCLNLPNNRRQVWSWKLSRTRSLSANATSAIDQIIDSIQVLNNRFFETVNNSDDACFYYPEANGQPVVFRGICDQNIPVVTGFDAEWYMGVWYDIESYPQFFQDGTCSTAAYGLIDEGVNVFNTQVINQTLDSIIGLAVPVPSDIGEAKLTVTFPVAGTNQTINSPYWVLATDYINYALVYSCQNIPVTTDQPMRSVTSWKLSRERTLSNASAEAINNVINTIPVLSQNYYELRGHTDEDCFYFPEPVVGKPVVFPGQCNNNKTAVPDFDLNRFSGVWHEIESYPSDQQRGQCINNDFNATSPSSMSLVRNEVYNQRLDIVLGSANVISTDGSARLNIIINSEDSVIEIPYWILDTDYENYALAYSCVNINSTFRGVWSWKLSREKQLSASSNTAINAAIANIDILDQKYYEPVLQTDAACFYYPELRPNEPVTFIGQCDQSIAVVENFNAAEFAGRWFDIESYFDDFLGDCKDSTFTLSGNDTFDIKLTQVVNDKLDVTLSRAVMAIDNSGKLTVTTNGVEYEYWILETDYTNFALLYSCQDMSENRRRIRSWKMSRTRQLSDNATIAINSIINLIDVLDAQYYNSRDHGAQACFYYPEPKPKEPVIFRGRCDDNINVVTDFDVGRYLDVWYDIESYPAEFQEGTCGKAEYKLGPSDTVDVTNTQVVAQRLDIIKGTAVVVSPDGSAKLNVTFPIRGTDDTITSPYWVLATDYENFALVYSCYEIDEEYKRVNSWKLSRQQAGLTNESNTIINDVINSVPVLRQEYYQPMSQTPDDCFFYPPLTDGKVYLQGQCPDKEGVETVRNFNSEAFSGTWHEVSRFPSELRQGTCATKSLDSTATVFSFTTSMVVNEELVSISVPATLSNDGRSIISTSLQSEEGESVSMDLYVLATDYTEFALLYSCRYVDNETKQINSWQLSRSREGLSEGNTAAIDAIVSNNDDLFEDYYEVMNQTSDGCFYYPDFNELPEEIRLPGPCDNRITAMPDFNAAAYVGRWFEIERYPVPEQTGSCNRVEYSDEEGIRSVHHNEVVNRTLQTQFGTAILANDGSGLFTVDYVVSGGTRQVNYYVLQTDYENYSLVYSCRDVNNGDRQERIVSSWKLSRTRELSNASNTAMDDVIANTQGLIQRYYIKTSQTDEDCFYVPELDETQPMIFRGQCDENVAGVQGFVMEQFVGWWHEIESYPTEEDGTCRNSRYTGSGSQFQVVDTVVKGLDAELNTYAVTATTNGQLIRTSNDVDETWIVLATDYENYALLYYCENIDSEHRRVWSAKHSRTQQLTEEAQNSLAPIIAANPVLYPQFYLKADQSEEACFYYPPADGRSVTLRGQCDNNIPVVTDFQVDDYSGTWYQTERYPQQWETGNCTGARYTVNNAEDRIDVVNWQVVDGELDVIRGHATAIPSENNEAKLIVELPSRIPDDNGTVSSSLYVLATDYASYSLAFTCHNVNDFEQRIYVWKLSRTRTMPAAGTTAINQYMATRRELDQRYFEDVFQDEDCPDSSFLVKSSFIVILVCGILQLLL
ncbi:uncharacterized protein LOC113240270 [Hyposmocoma kahamanoa]|uniref:uncharacterized protein LOC113240270 n=1 Tax=Hyposmocoma kahamanoa TaxID=1477025 RepID=UPI000E6D780C|nr:uncharacterized protein LOC113240270 [Hyposmocoma kahamanoa]